MIATMAVTQAVAIGMADPENAGCHMVRCQSFVSQPLFSCCSMRLYNILSKSSEIGAGSQASRASQAERWASENERQSAQDSRCFSRTIVSSGLNFRAQ